MILKQIILNLINANIRNKLPKIIKLEHADVEEALLDAIFTPYEVKQLDCPQQFIEDNFNLVLGPSMGLGKNLMLGYAICNGNNGTKNRNGRVGLSYDPINYASIGDIGGSKDGSVIEHSHYSISADQWDAPPNNQINNSNPNQSVKSSGNFPNNDWRYVLEASDAPASIGKSSVVGVAADNKNLQPYIISLFVQRI